jgi:hypothetical protein
MFCSLVVHFVAILVQNLRDGNGVIYRSNTKFIFRFGVTFADYETNFFEWKIAQFEADGGYSIAVAVIVFGDEEERDRQSFLVKWH